MKWRVFSSLMVLTMAVTFWGCYEPDPMIIIDDNNPNGTEPDVGFDVDDAEEIDPNFNNTDPAYVICGAGDAEIEGRVVDSDGDPVAGIHVHVGYYRERFDFDDEFTARCTGAITRDDGTFHLVAVNEHDSLIRAREQIGGGVDSFELHEGFAEVEPVSGEVHEHDIELEVTRQNHCGDSSDGATVSGVVYRADQSSTAPTSRLALLQNEECGTIAGTGGIYKIEELPAGDYNLIFTEGRWRGSQFFSVEAGDEIELDLVFPSNN